MTLTNYLLATTLTASLFAGSACQSARPASMLPPRQANAPALTGAANSPLAADDKLRHVELIPQAPKPDPAAELIASVEQEYQSGQEDLKVADMESAREHFDRALDLLVATPLELQSD